MSKSGIISCAIVAVFFTIIFVDTSNGQAAPAAGMAGQAASGNNRPGQPIFGINGGGGGNNRGNWNAGGTVGVGTKVWESQNGRHSIGAGVAASQSFGRSNGQSWQSRPNVGVGAGYTFRFGKK